MKILTIAPTPFFADRGTHIRILEEARAQVRRGHAVTIAAYHIGATPNDTLSQKIDVRRIHRWLFWYKKLEAGPDWQKILLDLFLLRKVLFLALRTKPDVIHAHLHEGVLIGWCVQRILFWRKIILVADMHGSLVGEMASHGYLSFPFIRKFFSAVEHWLNNRGDIMVASSWENQKMLKKMRDGDVIVQPDGVDVTYYKKISTVEREKLRTKHGIKRDAIVIIYTGAMVPNKGVHYLLEAMILVQKHNSRAHFVFAGFPREYIDQFLHEKQSVIDRERVSLITPLPYTQLPHLLLMADIAVDPKDSSVHQASGKILQYMGAALPVVCFDKENNRAYLEDAGIYASDVTADGLARALIRAVNDIDIRAHKGARARERASLFTWDRGARIFDEAVYRVQKRRQRDMATK